MHALELHQPLVLRGIGCVWRENDFCIQLCVVGCPTQPPARSSFLRAASPHLPPEGQPAAHSFLLMNRPPAFQFYPKDWLDFKVQRMSLAAQGFYMKILCFMWKDSRDQCSIPTAVEPLSRALGVTALEAQKYLDEIQCEKSPILLVKGDVFISKRLKEEVRVQLKYRRRQALKGHLSAISRSNRGSTVVQPTHVPKPNSSSSSSSSKKRFCFICGKNKQVLERDWLKHLAEHEKERANRPPIGAKT